MELMNNSYLATVVDELVCKVLLLKLHDAHSCIRTPVMHWKGW